MAKAKDRAAPFSRKHRRYWIPVLGGMIVIGALNLAIGMCSYSPAPDVTPIQLHIPDARPFSPQDAAGTISTAELPLTVIRAFNEKYPRTVPTGAMRAGDNFTVTFGTSHTATFAPDGTFISEN